MSGRRWIVSIRFRHYSKGQVVGETNTTIGFWTKFFARRYEREVNHQPGYVATLRRARR